MVADTNRQSNMHMVVACGIIITKTGNQPIMRGRFFLTAGDLNSTEVYGRSIEIFE